MDSVEGDTIALVRSERKAMHRGVDIPEREVETSQDTRLEEPGASAWRLDALVEKHFQEEESYL